MAQIGSPVLVFGGITFNETAAGHCLQSATLSSTAEAKTYKCTGNVVTLPGNVTTEISVTCMLDRTDSALIALLKNGTPQTDLVFSPFGTATGSIQITSDNSVALGYTQSETVGEIVMVSFTIHVNNTVEGVAA